MMAGDDAKPTPTPDDESPAVVVEEQPSSWDQSEGPDKPRQWLIDRCNGESKIDAETLGRPFCPICWPPPCVKWLPDILEQNACCQRFGKIGFFSEDHSTSRIWLMRKSLVTHLAGIILSVLACFSISSNPDLLQAFSFSSGVVTGSVGDIDVQEVIFRVGLTTIYVDDFAYGARTYGLDELCTGTTVGIPLTSAEDCETCADASSALVATMFLALIAYLPTIASNINRSYYNYDVNCQKVFGTLVALFSMAMSLYTWQGYANQCFASFFDGEVTVPVWVAAAAAVGNNTNGTAVGDPTSFFIENFDPSAFANFTAEDFENYVANNGTFTQYGEDVVIRVAKLNFDWSAGTGLILIVVATFIKLIDIINHFLIRTPSITRDRQEQMEYEKKYGAVEDEADETEA